MRRLAALSLLLMAGATLSQSWDLRVCLDANNLPYSNEQGEGYENAIAQLVADELGAELVSVFLPAPHAVQRSRMMELGECDLSMSVIDGDQAYLTTVAYYRSSYVFIYPRDARLELSSLDDPVLQELRIGVQQSIGEGISPAAQALAMRELLDNLVAYRVSHGTGQLMQPVVEAVAEGQVDVALVWGPAAGFFAGRSPVDLELVPVSPEIDMPFMPYVFSVSLGVRPGDIALRDRLSQVLAGRWDDVQAILDDFGVPRLPLPAPGGSLR